MNIVVVTPNIPRPWSGASTRNYHLLRALAAAHRVSLIAINELPGSDIAAPVEHLRTLTRSLRVVEPAPAGKRRAQIMALASLRSYRVRAHTLSEVQVALDDIARREPVELVLYESVEMASYRVPPLARVVIDEHNIEHELQQRAFKREMAPLRKAYHWLEYRLLRPVELERCRHADAVITTSERDERLLRRLLPEARVAVVPNGVDLRQFTPAARAAEVPGRIVFTGALTYHPNVQAVLHFAEHGWPAIHRAVPHSTWHIVGRFPPRQVQHLAEQSGITVTGAVADVTPHLAAAQVAVAPLLVGSGTRMKILEAFAMGKAVVSTTIGAEGLSVVSGEHLTVADAPTDFAAAVIALLRDDARRTRYGAAGRRLVEAEYGWERSGAALLEVVERALREGIACPSGRR
jgi:sugar transferase (PEP-CTERM/EpsH1 system associated)